MRIEESTDGRDSDGCIKFVTVLHDPCCQMLRQFVEETNDCLGLTEAFTIDGHCGPFEVWGSDNPTSTAIKYCPWCGKKIDREE